MTTRFLDTANSVMDRLGLARPGALVGSSDPNARRIVALITETGEELYAAHDWSVLAREYEFTTEIGVDNYAMPEDFGRSIGDTAWDRTSFWRLRGSLSPQQWQHRRSGLAATASLTYGYRALIGPRQASILLDPVPGSANTMVIEYVTKFWLESSAGDGKEEFQTDTHHTRIDDRLFRLGLTYRLREAYGKPYLDAQAEYEAALDDAIADDLSLPAVCATTTRRHGPNVPLVPDGSWDI